MNNLLAFLGQDPRRSLAIFLRGLGLFVFGLLCIALGYYYHHLWQLVGLVVIALASIIAIWGYVGIFANRWFTILNRTQVNQSLSAKNDKDN
ncbi:MAG: hypothetical protein QF552_05105 [Litorilituus sp.]|jgi:hypothetical protein|nr:hypothetical protein [Litorilituus sp.]